VTTAEDAIRVAAEQDRILAEYRRREREVDADRYAAWNPSAIFLRSGRIRSAARLLEQASVFPRRGDACLEIGFGSLGWLAEMLSWGLREADLHGLELDAERAARAREVFPAADLRVGDATHLPWADGFFRLVIASTVFSSILDEAVRRLVAAEVARVLAPGGALLWYDLRVNNPSNPNVRRVSRRELRGLFPTLHGTFRSVTLAPPLARRLAPASFTLAHALETIPLLRTHWMAVFVRGNR
jgi:ubiquinone/menaquinone biosynthesis C-methylase UbiE